MGGTIKVGTRITDGKGNYKEWSGSAWQDVRASAAAPELSKQQEIELAKMRGNLGAVDNTRRLYNQVEEVVKRFGTGPYRGGVVGFLTPEPDDGIVERVIGSPLGWLAKTTGLLPEKDIADYQDLKAMQSERVAERQLEQKGVQTESDAARYKLADISPSNTIETNARIIARGRKAMDRASEKVTFYTKWANRFGLNGLNKNGVDVNRAWEVYQQMRDAELNKAKTNAPSATRIK